MMKQIALNVMVLTCLFRANATVKIAQHAKALDRFATRLMVSIELPEYARFGIQKYITITNYNVFICISNV